MTGVEVLQLGTRVLGAALLGLGTWMWVKYDDGRPVILMVAGALLLIGSGA